MAILTDTGYSANILVNGDAASMMTGWLDVIGISSVDAGSTYGRVFQASANANMRQEFFFQIQPVDIMITGRFYTALPIGRVPPAFVECKATYAGGNTQTFTIPCNNNFLPTFNGAIPGPTFVNWQLFEAVIPIKEDVVLSKFEFRVYTGSTTGFYYFDDLSVRPSGYNDFLQKLKEAKEIVDLVTDSQKKLKLSAFEAVAFAAINGINDSKSEVKYDSRGIVLEDKVDPLKRVIMSATGIMLTTDGGATTKAAIHGGGIVAEQIVGVLGQFAQVRATSIVVGTSGQKIPDSVIESATRWDTTNAAADQALQEAQNAIAIANQASADAADAETAANSAQAAATAAQTSADSASSAIADIANDNKLTPVEKQRTKQEWDAIVAEKPLIDAQSISFNIGYPNMLNQNQSGVDLNTSGLFTSGVTGPVTVTRDTTVYDIGPASARLTNNHTAQQNITLFTDFLAPVNVGKSYRFTVWSRWTTGSSSSVRFRIEWFNSSDASLGTTDTNFTGSGTSGNIFTVTSTCPSGAAKAKVSMIGLNWPPSQSLWWDTAIFRQVSERDDYLREYQELAEYLNRGNPLSNATPAMLINLSATETIVGTTFRDNFNQYYTARQNLLNAIAAKAKALADAAQSAADAAAAAAEAALQPGVQYNGVVINTTSGLVVSRTDGLVKTILNATTGITIQKNTGTFSSPVWQDQFYADSFGNLFIAGNITGGTIKIGTGFDVNASGILTATGAIISGKITMGAGSSIDWGNVNKPSYSAAEIGALATDSPRLTYIGSDGIYTGTLTANKILAGTLTGFTIQTSASAADRVVMSGSGLASYDSSGVKRISMESGGGYGYHELRFYGQNGLQTGTISGTNGTLNVYATGNLIIGGSVGMYIAAGIPFVDFQNVPVRNLNVTAKFG